MIESPIHKQTLAKVFCNPRDLAGRLEVLRPTNRIVLVKGAYDLFHVGHYYSFVGARTFGNVLVVAVNDDAAISARKSPERPVLALNDRMILIAALSCVDFVTTYDAPSPFEVISLLRPDVFAASHFESLTQEQRASIQKTTELQVVPKLGGTSTTSIIRKIKGLQNA